MYTICQTSYANLVMLLVYNKYLEIDYYSISYFATAPIRPERHNMILKILYCQNALITQCSWYLYLVAADSNLDSSSYHIM